VILPTLAYGSENWKIKAKYKIRIPAPEMGCMRLTAKYDRMDYKRNEDMAEELKT
jgi:hypothetical protein